ncbi:arylsulfatase [Marinoscillum furvescens]|uniref:Arylsulfatase A-like enzyme n=1 Tax=Marinoscillum furvescens DSM 4134 TaxID=1122208 RepID=A0A3D9L0Q7_MARFU|nr:arylsulfatase [Marinoscillum furvescens]RED96021.1 arylsulfatase A-like enzyme [Marinoscillum furvescens DSM 4134]
MHWKTHLFLITLVGLFLACKPSTPPNIILIVTDDQGWGDVGFHGNEIVKTPQLDAFAKNAVELTNYHSGTTCTPTRAAIMTGRNSNRNGAWHTIAGASILNADEQTIAEVFQQNGYRTGMIGKWHLGDNYPYRPQDRGFEETFYLGGGGVQQTPDYWNNDYFDDTYFRNGVPEKTKGYCTDVWFDEALKFIGGADEKPFFLYLATNAAHGPFNVPPAYREMYADSELNSKQKNFYGMLTNLDDNFGKLEKYLKDNKLLDNTILIYTTDNGTAGGIGYNRKLEKTVGFNPLRGTKGSHYDGGHRVPFLIHWPAGGLTGGQKVDELTASVDLLPTLSSLAGIPLSLDRPLDGADVSPVLTGQKTTPTRMLVVDTQRNQWPEKYRNPCVMDGPWRLVNHKELYNIEEDPKQQNDLANQHPDRVKDMQNFYDKWWASTVDDWEHSAIYLGAAENPTTITIHDMHPDSTGAIPWNQNQVRMGKISTPGYYEINVAEAGRYQFELARWPFEAGLKLNSTVEAIPDLPHREGLSAGNRVVLTSSQVMLAGTQQSVEIQPDAPHASMEIEVPAGKTQLRASFLTQKNEHFPAYYIRVTKL